MPQFALVYILGLAALALSFSACGSKACPAVWADLMTELPPLSEPLYPWPSEADVEAFRALPSVSEAGRACFLAGLPDSSRLLHKVQVTGQRWALLVWIPLPSGDWSLQLYGYTAEGRARDNAILAYKRGERRQAFMVEELGRSPEFSFYLGNSPLERGVQILEDGRIREWARG